MERGCGADSEKRVIFNKKILVKILIILIIKINLVSVLLFFLFISRKGSP